MLEGRLRSLTTAVVVLLLSCLAIVVVALSMSACRPVEPEHPPTYDATSCTDACHNARKLCGPATLTPSKGGTCEDVCAATESGGGDFRTGCLSAAQTCPAVEACSR